MATRAPVTETTPSVETIEVRATARFIRMSPTKVRQVVDLIRGRHAEDARRVLRYTPRAAAAPVAKVLDSAIANAEHNRGLSADELTVTRAWVDEGPTLRRFRPRAMGRATRVRKRTSHISVVVGRVEPPVPPAAPPARQTARRERKDATGTGDASAPSSGRATAGDESTPKKTTRKKTTTRKTTARKTTTPKTTARKTTKKKEGDA